MAGWSEALLVPAGAPAGVATGPWWDLPGTRRCTLAALRDGIPPPALTRAIKYAEAPALVLHGTADDVVPWAAARRWVPSIAGVLVKVVDGAGHWLAAERPGEVADEILAFMEEER
jgi:pimeloyl-ACP methyl ester carboxylesterase